MRPVLIHDRDADQDAWIAHVIPTAEQGRHRSSLLCECKPHPNEDDSIVIMHHSFGDVEGDVCREMECPLAAGRDE